jgi:hypothetical protein
VTSSILIQDENQDDGTYYSDTSDARNISNCIIPSGINKITLDPLGSPYNYYNFSDWTVQSHDTAYTYNIVYFTPILPQFFILNYLANEINQDLGYSRIGENDGITYPLEQFPDLTALQQIHHFRFKITQDLESISLLQGIWYGSGLNIKKLELYVWKPLISSIGIWEKVSSTEQTNNSVILAFSYNEDFPLSEEEYIDFCIVSTPVFGEKCSLFTDFVNLIAHGEGYASEGTVESPIIIPNQISHWEIADWNDYQPDQTSIRYQIYYENKSGILKPVENTYISGNNNGFTSGPIYLRNVPTYYNISFKITLKTNDISISPEIYNWGIAWQTNSTFWKDGFSTELRIPQSLQQKVTVRNDSIQLLPSIYDWPMFGQNPANTRSNGGSGPGADHTQLAWYTVDSVGGDQRNPILKNGNIYIGSADGTRLFMFDAQANIDQDEPNPKIKESNQFDYKFVNTPAATNLETIIIATGESQRGGNVENIVYALDDTSFSEEWIFKYSSIDSDNPSICYDASPVVTDNYIFLTSWSGDSSILDNVWNILNFSNENNKLICLSLNGNYKWSFDLPAGSFSTPAISENLVIVGCENLYGSSVFAVDMDGDLIWEKNLGPIGKASPVIYEDKIFIISKELTNFQLTGYAKLTALQLSNGEILWNTTIDDLQPDDYRYIGCNTPCISEDIIFIASQDGVLSAYQTITGDEIWKKTIYTKSIINPYLQSSPAYTDEFIYLGTPSGYFYAFDTDGNETWKKSTIEQSSILSSPVIADGLVYYNSDNGVLHAVGELETPEDMQITGRATSIPIYSSDDENQTWGNFYYSSYENDGSITFSILDRNQNPILNNVENGSNLNIEKLEQYKSIRLKATFKTNTNGEAILHWWKIGFVNDSGSTTEGTIFYENSFETEGIPPNCSIDVENDEIGINTTTAKFKLEYRNIDNDLVTTSWIEANCTNDSSSTNKNISKNRETITVNLSYHNFSENLTFIQIRFSINDANDQITYSNWHEFPQQEYADSEKPIFYLNEFTPKEQYITSPTPVCTIRARDQGPEGNISGIDVNSAHFEINYQDNEGTHTETYDALCSGINGTSNNVTITADISQLENSENITQLFKIRFSISDIAGNSNTSPWFELEMDDTPPTSSITNSDDISLFVNTSPVVIKVEASDDLSGIQHVGLYYRKTEQTQWSLFETKKTEGSFTWNFTIGSNDGGEYELISIATDKAGNEESYPTTGEVIFVYDPNKPSKPSFSSLYEFTKDEVNEDEIPIFTDITFTDDYLLDSVSYRMDFEGSNIWTKINTQTINQNTYKPSWKLSDTQWETMQEDTTYYIYFKIIDVLGNKYETPNDNEAMKILKNFDISEFTFSPDFSDFENWKWNNEYNIRVIINDSEVSLKLFYSYSKENSSNYSWKQYGENLTNGSNSWKFKPEEGEGYYSFKIEMEDKEGKIYTSNIYTTYISQFPLIELGIILILTIILIIISILLYQKKRKIGLIKRNNKTNPKVVPLDNILRIGVFLIH